MAKRGRSKGDGSKPATKLGQMNTVLAAYDSARAHGEKRLAAIDRAIEASRHYYPNLAISATEVKRILAEYRSPTLSESLIIVEEWVPWTGLDLPQSLAIPEGWTDQSAQLSGSVGKTGTNSIVRVIRGSFGPNPTFPRTNAADSFRKRKRKVN